MCRNAANGRRIWASALPIAPPAPPIWTRRLDGIFLHPVAGPLIFAAIVVAVFQSIFSWAKPIMDYLQSKVAVVRRLDEACAARFAAQFAVG